VKDKSKNLINYENIQIKKTRFYLILDEGMDFDIINNYIFLFKFGYIYVRAYLMLTWS
jgi:hypothetical protein